MSVRWLAGVLVGLTVVMAVAAPQRATAQDRVEQGRREFTQQGCHGCHTVQKMGTPIGPDLSHVGAKYSESSLKNWLRDPASQRPAAHMPKLELTEAQIASIAAFLAVQQ
jgi:mono/diheme cytochrome c family protein